MKHSMKLHLNKKFLPYLLTAIIVTGSIVYLAYSTIAQLQATLDQQQSLTSKTKSELQLAEQELNETKESLLKLQNEDQYLKNEELGNRISNIESTYDSAVSVYENLLKLKETNSKTNELDESFTEILILLSEHNYASAEAEIKKLDSSIAAEQAKLVQSFTIPENVTVQNTPPSAGYSRQQVDTPVGSYLVDIVAADLNSTRVVVDTASSGDCTTDCPVDSLASFVSRSGGYAGINGPYFCPASYPSCAGKTNSFDTLIMNKDKTYFNSDNNVYSTVPAVVFSGNSARFVSQSLQWGRDTGVDAVIASQPMLMLNGQRVFGGDGEPKREGKGSRSFIGTTGSTVYIGVVRNASVAEVAYVLETMGISNALNLDSGGSTAMMYQGRYYAGPGRNTPFGIVLQSK